MSERLRADDLALLAEEAAQTPMHNATLEIFDPADSGFDYDALLAHIDDRIAFVPRYRQHVRRVLLATGTHRSYLLRWTAADRDWSQVESLQQRAVSTFQQTT